jgi:hypothetical protein
MRDQGNWDNKIDVEPQTPDPRRQMPKGGTSPQAYAENGYATLDQADTEQYSSKERRGSTRDANISKRF